MSWWRTDEELKTLSFLLLRHPKIPLPHWLLTGAAEWHQDVRRGWDFPSWEARNAHDGLLRHGDGWRRLDGTKTSVKCSSAYMKVSLCETVCVCVCVCVCPCVSVCVCSGLPEEERRLSELLQRLEGLHQRIWESEWRVLARWDIVQCVFTFFLITKTLKKKVR